jgi:hypothetical protein
MPPRLRLVYPYYDNPQMLRRQVRNWNAIAPELAERVEIVLVDDASPLHPALPIFSECRLQKKLLRVDVDIAWHQHAARNIGAHEAGEDEAWLLMSDMDILLPPLALQRLLEKPLDADRHYGLQRVFLPRVLDRMLRSASTAVLDSMLHRPGMSALRHRFVSKPHCNSFLVRRDRYWAINGYDEDFVGSYGGDGVFLDQLSEIAPPALLDDVYTIAITPKLIADANTQRWERGGEMRRLFEQRLQCKREAGAMRSSNPLRTPWTRLL